MIDISSKIETLREATAEGRVCLPSDIINLIKDKKVPKGDVLEVSRVVGISWAKRVSDILPFCHPVPIDWLSIEYEIKEDCLIVHARAKAIYKTGVEMEAITAVSIACLNVYDMVKPLTDKIEIKGIKLIEKTGGKSDFIEEFSSPLKTAVIVMSDTIYAGKKQDKAGKSIIERLKGLPVDIIEYKVIPDEKDIIEKEIVRLADELKINLIITTGGTGLSPRDVTVDVVKKLIQREIPGISEAIRSYGQRRTPYSMLSRGIAGIRGDTMIITLPGSTKGAIESMDALFPAVLHGFKIMRGGKHKTGYE